MISCFELAIRVQGPQGITMCAGFRPGSILPRVVPFTISLEQVHELHVICSASVQAGPWTSIAPADKLHVIVKLWHALMLATSSTLPSLAAGTCSTFGHTFTSHADADKLSYCGVCCRLRSDFACYGSCVSLLQSSAAYPAQIPGQHQQTTGVKGCCNVHKSCTPACRGTRLISS